MRHPLYQRGNIYLSGGMQYASDLGSNWRANTSKMLKSLGYFPLDICELDRAYAEKNGELLYESTNISRAVNVATELQAKSNIRKHFVKADLDLIEHNSDGVIVFYDDAARRGAGTISECQHAYNRNIPIFLVSEYEDWASEVPGWLQALTTRAFTSFNQLYDYLEELPEGILIKDRYGNRHAGNQYLCCLCGTAFQKRKHQFVSTVTPLYCSPCVDLTATTWENLEDRYEFFLNTIQDQIIDELTKQKIINSRINASPETKDTDEDEHFPWCEHVQNLARPQSMQLIGPKCHCIAERKRTKMFCDWLESDEGKAALTAVQQE